MSETTFSIPEDLIQAIEIGSFERQLPKQGDSCVHRCLMDPEDKELQQEVEEWIEAQKGLWAEVNKVIIRLHDTAGSAEDGRDYPWVFADWWMVLCMPWSSNLNEAIQSANQWCDGQSA
jgi:hypothetical protein